MSYREEFEYHVMNCRSGRLTYSCNSEREALEYANRYADGSGATYMILKRTAAVYSVKSVKVERS